MRPGLEAKNTLSNGVPSANANPQVTPQGRNVDAEDANALVRQIEAMAETLGKRLYRGLLKTGARVWNPTEIRDADVLRKVLAQMQAAERGLRRLEAALDKVSPEALVPILHSLRLSSLHQVDSLETLKTVVLAAERAGENTR